MVEAYSGETETVAERRQGLAEDAARLILQLRQQRGDRRASRRVDAAGGNELIGQRLNALPSQGREGGHRNVVHIKSIRNVYADVTGEIVVDVKNLYVE